MWAQLESTWKIILIVFFFHLDLFWKSKTWRKEVSTIAAGWPSESCLPEENASHHFLKNFKICYNMRRGATFSARFKTWGGHNLNLRWKSSGWMTRMRHLDTIWHRTIILDTSGVSENYCYQDLTSRSGARILKTLVATNNLALSLPNFSMVALLLFELSFCLEAS